MNDIIDNIKHSNNIILLCHKNHVGISSTMEFNLLKEKLIEEVGKKINEWRASN